MMGNNQHGGETQEDSIILTEPDNWQDHARSMMEQAWGTVGQLTTFSQLLRMALNDDDYPQYVEALLWLAAEEVEP